MDVSEQILKHHLIYGGSDNTNADRCAASYSINYAHGTSIYNPIEVSFTSIPYTMKFKDSIGLTGVENLFYKVNLKIDMVNGCLEDDGYECMKVTWVDDLDEVYEGAVIDFYKDQSIVNYYEPAEFVNKLPNLQCPKTTVSLRNLGTGNKYNDSWLDVRLYDQQRRPIAENDIWINAESSFYIGFHARNTRRLPFNVECVIGQQYKAADDTKKSKYGAAACGC